ncbi:uncharacterized protein LOC113238279 [Hyposmocoma kahamanoa]|uniref:uncharacterized protein LOC113238279 n=1 Tax=Hyposmocoma kahamanoa TaxID=1477025 RepID=UPI000E6D721E|nr:uncharacterized protein LOC113238279 [Hyposmocoma kahamanoa]
MALPVARRCCGFLSMDTGCFIYCIISIVLCLCAMGVGSWKLPRHREQRNEDNMILMSYVMFSTLSCISNFVAIVGIIRKRSSYLQVSLLTNSVFILCIFLVVVVTCLFSPTLKLYTAEAGYIVLIILLVVAGFVYSVYYLMILNSMYCKLKMTFSDSAIPV